MGERGTGMTDAPEKIWTYAGSFKMWRGHKIDMGQRQTEYTRTDVADAREVAAINLGRYFADTANTQQARIKELEAAYGEACDRIAELGAALRAIEGGVVATRTDVADARITELEAALGEFARFASRKDKNGASVPFGQSKLHAARAVLKGEKT
jgi:hypothetical protein